MWTPEHAVMTAMGICVAGAAVTALTSRCRTLAGWLALAITTASAVLVLTAVTQVLTTGLSAEATAFWAMPRLGFALRLHVDGLSAVFLLLAASIAVPAALYSIVYMRGYSDYGVGRYYPYFLLFLAAMYGLVSTTDMMWFFFIFWQMMTLPGYALIRFEHRKPENARAARKFLVMMQLACAATMVGAELLAVAGTAAAGGEGLKYDFESVSANLPALLSARPGVTALAFGLFLVGFGIKMGMWPFGQVWLPDAHPAAPSPVSAMLSGVMIKTGVYGLMRYFLWLVPPDGQSRFPLATWGGVVAVLGALTLFTGTLQALREEQSKRLLAFHSIGQVGYILLGAGVSMVVLTAGGGHAHNLATLGFCGALFHVLNHGLFKGLLFLNAGSILHATGTQDLNRLGGLIRYMPLTALTALVASLSISGVPLFNGFVSKWAIYVATAQAGGGKPYLAVCALVAILTSALTLASFVKFFGASFLSRTSELVAGRAQRGRLEVGTTMQTPQLALALLCLLLGLFPALGFGLLGRALDCSPGGYGPLLATGQTPQAGLVFGLETADDEARFAPLALVLVLGAAWLAARVISTLGRSSRRADAPWLCGYVREAECHRYGAHHFYGPLKRYCRWLGGGPAGQHPPRSQDS